MSTPSDFFNSDSNDPQRRDPTPPADKPDREQAPAADTGAQHRGTQQPAGERWQPPQPPQAPRWKTAPHQSGPLPQAPQGTVSVSRPAPPQVPPPYQPFAAQDPAGQPPNPEPHNNTGAHHRPPQQGQPNPAAAPAPQSGQSDPAAPAAAPARRDVPGEYDERTSVISPSSSPRRASSRGSSTSRPIPALRHQRPVRSSAGRWAANRSCPQVMGMRLRHRIRWRLPLGASIPLGGEKLCKS